MSYTELEGIWHVVRDGVTICGREVDEVQDLDFTPRPLCWRCREKA